MNDLVTIAGIDMEIREYNSQRVVTFKDIDAVHQRPSGTARRNFNKNKKHFIEGEDYFKVCANEIRTRKIIDIPTKATEDIILITETGYLMIVKSFKDDLAWEVQRSLVNSYFKERKSKQRIGYQTSNTPVPKNPEWFQRNQRRMEELAEYKGIPITTVYHRVLARLGEEFNLDAARKIYENELGYPPKYALDIVSYFPDLANLADDYLDKVEEYVYVGQP